MGGRLPRVPCCVFLYTPRWVSLKPQPPYKPPEVMYDGLYGWQVEGGFERGGRLVKDHWSNPTPQKRLKIPSYGLIFAKFVTFLKTHGGEKNELHTANNFLGDGCHKKSVPWFTLTFTAGDVQTVLPGSAPGFDKGRWEGPRSRRGVGDLPLLTCLPSLYRTLVGTWGGK